MSNIAPYLRVIYDEDDAILSLAETTDSFKLRWRCTQIGETMLQALPMSLKMEPVIEIATITPEYLRPSISREVKMLQWAKVNVRKVWKKMTDAVKREEITSVINTVACMKRLGINHVGLESAFSNWAKENR